MKKFKLIIFILLIISFMIVLFYGIFGVTISFLSSKEIKANRELKEDLINKIKINNLETVYDKQNNTYYYMVSEDYENSMYVLNLDLENGFKYKIVGETLNVIKVNYDKQIKIIIYNDKYYYETKIQLTNLPIISIISDEDIGDTDIETKFKYINAGNEIKTIMENAKIHVRGASSRYFDKKSYRVDFYNKNYKNDKNVNISDFYYGDSFVLDAIYRDPSKIRNLLSTELWNAISQDFTNISINSEFVEVFINNEYKGLYVLTEPIKRKKLNLNKSASTDTSIIIKSKGWYTPEKNYDFSSITDEFYLDYELKYPNDEELYSKAWSSMLSKLSNYYNSSEKDSYEVIDSTWNMENYIDITIFNSFINNQDNQLVKNNYFYMKKLKDEKIFIQPWDMEYSFGMSYYVPNERNILIILNDYNKIYTKFEHKNSPEINKLLIDRYWELRKSVLTKEYFDDLLDKYKDELSKGSAKRDSKKWYEYDVEKEIEDIRIWIYNRLDYFDHYVESLENE